MIAADTSSLVAFFSGSEGSDTDRISDAMRTRILFLPPPVLSEILSDPKLPDEVEKILLQFPLLPTRPGLWERAGKTRALILRHKKKARLGDALIAQFCLDEDIALVTRDTDFTVFERLVNLKIVR